MNLGGLVPCFFCERDGGRTMFGKKWPKAAAVAPFLPEQRWPTNPACATHGTQLAAYSHLVKAPLAAVAHNLEAVENSDLLWNEMPRMAPPHHHTTKVAQEGPSLPSIAVVEATPRPDPAVAAFVNAAVNAPSPGMTDAEIAAFDANVPF